MGLKHHPSGCKTGLGVRCSLTAHSPEVKNSAPDAPHSAINTAARMPLQYHHAPCHMMPRYPRGVRARAVKISHFQCLVTDGVVQPRPVCLQPGVCLVGARGRGSLTGARPEAGFPRAPRGTQGWPFTIDCLLVAVHSVNRAVLHASADGIRPDAPPISPGARAAAHRSPPPAAPISHRARTPASH